MIKNIIAKILKSKILLLLTSKVHLWELKQVAARCDNTVVINNCQKVLLNDVVSYESVIGNSSWQYFKNAFELAGKGLFYNSLLVVLFVKISTSSSFKDDQNIIIF